MTIHLDNGRPGYTYIPDMVDEVTGETVENSGGMVPSHYANWAANDFPELAFDEGEEFEEVFDDQEHLSPEDQMPSEEVMLTETFDEILSTSYDINPDFADAIAQADVDQTDEMLTVQFLASEVYQGTLTPEEAFNTAVGSGLSPELLLRSYYVLKEAMNG